MSAQRTIEVTDWTAPDKKAAALCVWPVGHAGSRHMQLTERITMAIDTGCATLHLRMTTAEARKLADALHWALQPE